MAITRIACISLTTRDAEAAAWFYAQAFGFVRTGESEFDGVAYGVAGARVRALALRLGAQDIELAQFAPAGRAYPAYSRSCDPWFQHFAIVVADMDAAFRQLSGVRGWTAISADGPQKLPASSGGVTAFKFRDPEGHPLELLAFPPGARPERWRDAGSPTFLGVDHTAIAVADTAASVAFYRGLGLMAAGGSLNQGEAQARLDGLDSPVVEVTSLQPQHAPPHLELLCYRHPPAARAAATRDDDVASARLVVEGAGLPPSLVRDPDGHRLVTRVAV